MGGAAKSIPDIENITGSTPINFQKEQTIAELADTIGDWTVDRLCWFIRASESLSAVSSGSASPCEADPPPQSQQ